MINMIPSPKKYEISEQICSVPCSIYTDEPDFQGELEILVQAYERLYSVHPKFEKGGIELLRDVTLEAGTYVVDSKNGIKAYASDREGMLYALATLLQLTKYEKGSIEIPVLNIEDYPDKGYRSLMVDLSREWHPFDRVLKYVDVCFYLKINYLHLHFIDNERYTLPSRVLPKLPTENAHYSWEQIQELNSYAKKRGIIIVPEYECPGHACQFVEKYPEIFANHFGSNVVSDVYTESGSKIPVSSLMCGTSKASMDANKALLKEIVEMFPDSPYIHIGGDEAIIHLWNHCEVCTQYMKEHGIEDEHELYSEFVGQIASYILSLGRTPIVWEGFPRKGHERVPKETIVIAWESHYHMAYELLEEGFQIINASWDPLYIVPSFTERWNAFDILKWNVHRWQHWWPKSEAHLNPISVPATDRVMGAILCSWQQTYEQEINAIMENLAAMSERTWNVRRVVSDKEYNTMFKSQRLKLARFIQDY